VEGVPWHEVLGEPDLSEGSSHSGHFAAAVRSEVVTPGL